MDSGLGSDDEKRNRTKAQKQLQNEQKQLFSGCFIDATSLGDEGEFEHRRHDERRQGALVFRSAIPQYSMLQMSHSEEEGPSDKAEGVDISTPHNSIVQVEAEVGKKTPIGFYVDLGEVEVDDAPPAAPVEKKNIFSMVIDFNVPKREMPSRLSSSLYGRRKGSARSTLNSSGSNLSEGTSAGYESDSKRESSSKFEEDKEESAAESNGKSECGNDVSSTSPTIEANENGDKDVCEENEFKVAEENTNKIINSTTKSAVSNIPRPTQQYVKLSDLEAQSPRLDLFLAPRMSRSIPEKSWVESPLATFRSASYRSSPQPFNDLNDPSSSMTDSSSLPPKRPAQRLGTDLLRMFLEEIGPDVTLEAAGRKIRAHKCILSSRCHYFAAVFGGNPSESVVSIQGYSYAAVHFAMCHIYSGAAHIPQSISLVELAALADMLGLEGLKEVVAHALKVRHCHNFHTPCTGCIMGVVEVLPLAAAYGLDELYQSTLSWITQHFVEVWPNRTFANLPRELRDKCYQQHVVHMSADNVLETALSGDRLLAAMPTTKWAENVAQLALQLADHCQIYIRQNYASVLASSSFIALDSQLNLLQQLDDTLVSAAGSLKLDQACRSYIHCHKALQKTWSIPFTELLRKLNAQIEGCIVRQAAQASRSSIWLQLDPTLRKRIRDLSAAPTKKDQNPSSSSDSSRNSSPAIKSANRTQVHSPSLRRSLLMAARAPQTPSSPSTARRSTLTNPTQSSAAKSITKNTVPSQKPSASRAPKAPLKMPVKREPLQRGLMKASSTVLPKKPDVAQVKKSNVPNTPRTVKKSPMKQMSSSMVERMPQWERKSQVERKSQMERKCQVERKSEVEMKPKTPEKRSPGMRRSGTFLKDEPTVLGKIKQVS